MSISIEKQAEIDANYEAFQKLLPALLDTHRGQFAVMRHGHISAFMDTANDAFLHAQELYPDDIFSIQEISDYVVNLGWYSYAPAYFEVHS